MQIDRNQAAYKRMYKMRASLLAGTVGSVLNGTFHGPASDPDERDGDMQWETDWLSIGGRTIRLRLLATIDPADMRNRVQWECEDDTDGIIFRTRLSINAGTSNGDIVIPNAGPLIETTGVITNAGVAGNSQWVALRWSELP